MRIPYFVATALLLPVALAASPASARNYDCTKPGNANKVACKAATTPAQAPATQTKAGSTRHYDCTKPGNANKAACRGAATPPATAAATPPATKPVTTRHYDCTKLGNRFRAECRTAAPAQTTQAPVTPAPVRPASPTSSVTTNPAGATAQCKDGTYSHSQHHSGTCSRHGGVAKWLQ